MSPRVSILVPAFNVEPYVEAAMRSVLEQTFGDWELIAVDDASTDRTFELMRAFESPRVRVERNEQNLGMTANWNRCLSLARGELVIKLDADDVFRPRALEQLTGAMENPNVAACGIRTLLCDESLQPFDGIQGDDVMLRNGVDPYADAVIDGQTWYNFASLGHQLWGSCAFLFRRELVAGWDDRFGCASDTEMMWRVLEMNRPVAHRGAVGLLYRLRTGSVSDEYRKRGWLTWEAIAANLLSLSRVRKQRPLKRSQRMHYVRLWRLWHSSARNVPEPLCGRLEDVMRSVPPPPLLDVVMTRMRDGVSAG